VLIDEKDRLSAIALYDSNHAAWTLQEAVEVKPLKNLHLNHKVKNFMYFLEQFYDNPTNKLAKYCTILKDKLVVCCVG